MFTMSHLKQPVMWKNRLTSTMQAETLMTSKTSVIHTYVPNWLLAINNGLIDQDIEERYNFKPVYAACSNISGLDLTSI